MSAAKPVAPLPWQQDDDTYILDSAVESILAPTESEAQRGECYQSQDAAYIVAAANAYPRLVAALRVLADWTNENVSDPAVTIPLNEARTLLRELGENHD